MVLGNKKLPIFVKVLFPQLEDVVEFKRLSSDEQWMKQVVLMCKNCYHKVNRKFYEQAAQFERLEQVQTEF